MRGSAFHWSASQEPGPCETQDLVVLRTESSGLPPDGSCGWRESFPNGVRSIRVRPDPGVLRSAPKECPGRYRAPRPSVPAIRTILSPGARCDPEFRRLRATG